MEHIEEEFEIEDQVILTRPRFKRFKKKSDALSSDDASMEFDSLQEQQHRKHCLADSNRIALAYFPKFRSGRGTRQIQREEINCTDGAEAGAEIEIRAGPQKRFSDHGGGEGGLQRVALARRSGGSSIAHDERDAASKTSASVSATRAPSTMANLKKVGGLADVRAVICVSKLGRSG